MILESVENGLLLWTTVEENGVTRTKKYSELSATEAIQAYCDVKATNIILQGLPPEVYALVSTYKVEKELWERTQMLMQGQHEYHANEVRLMHEHTSDPLALVVNHQMNKSPYQPHQQSYHQHQFQPQVSIFQSSQYGTPYHSSQYASQAPSSTPLSITYPANDFKSSVNHNAYNPSSSIPQVEYAPTVHQQSEFSQPDTGLVVPVFQKGPSVTSGKQRVIVCYNYKGEGYMSKQCIKPKRKRDEAWFKDKIALMTNLSHYGSDNLAGVHNQDNLTNNLIHHDVQATSTSKQSNILNHSETEITRDSNIISYSQYMNESQYITVQNSSSPAQQDDLILSVIEQIKTQVINCTKINQENINVNEILTAELERYKDQKTDAILIRDSEETLMLEDESHSKMLQKQKDPMMSEKKVNTKPVDYAALNQLSKDFETRFIPQTELSVEQAFWLTELQKDFINKEYYDALFKQYTTLEKHCISLEVDSQLKQEISQRNNSFSQQSAPTFDQLFEINYLKAQSQENDTIIMKLKEIIKSLSALKETLTKLKGKAIVNEAVTLYPIDPELLKIDVAPLAPKVRNNRTAHNDYLKHTQKETTTLREILKNERLLNPLNTSLDYACKYTKRIQELLIILKQTCPCINDLGTKLMVVTPKNNNKKNRFTEHIPSSGNTPVKTTSSINVVSNTPVISSTRVNLLSSASGSQPQGNTKKDRIQRIQSKAKKNKLEDHHRTVRPSLNKKKSVVDTKAISSIPNSKSNVNYDLKCATCNGCLFLDNHYLCVLEFINSVNARVKSNPAKKPEMCAFLTRITTTAIVPLRKPIPLENNTSKPVVTLVYSRKSKAAKKKVPVSNSKINKSLIVQIVLWYLDSGCSKHMTGDRSQLINFVQKFLGTVKFENDHVAMIMGYGDYKIRNMTISRVYFLEELGHNLFSVGQFCDSNLEVAFRQHTCFIHNLDGVDLFTGSRGNIIYTLSLQDMMASSPICLLSKALKTKSWLWHRRLSHLNFGAINHLARQGLVRGALCCNNVQHSWSKHIEIRYHFIKEQVDNGVIELYFINTEYQLANLFTKALGRDIIEFLINKLGMRSFTPETLKQLMNEGDEYWCTMDTTIDQQVAMDKALVPQAKRLRIGRSNFCLLSDIKSKESTLQLEFWATATVHHYSIKFKIDNKKHIVNLESFREMLHICPRLPRQPFVEPPFEEEILAFLFFLGHNALIRKLTDVNINKLHQPWRSFAAIINKCLTGKSSGHDSLRLSQAQILLNTKIQRRAMRCIILDSRRDGHMYSMIKLVSRHQNMQQFGALLPIEHTNEDIRNSNAYKEYYEVATGVTPPKPKASVRKTRSSSDITITPPTAAAGPRLTTSEKGKQAAKASKSKSLSSLSEVAMTETQQLKLATKRSLQQIHISQASGSDADEGTSDDDKGKDGDDDDGEEGDGDDDDEDANGEEGNNDDDDDDQEVEEDDEKDDEEEEQTMNEQLEAEVLTWSSNSSKTSYAIAADLSEMELKKILIEKIEGNKDTVTLKRRRDDDADKDEKPSARQDRGSKRRREMSASKSATAEEPMQTTFKMEEPSHLEFETGADDQPIVESSQHPVWFSQQQKPPTLDHDWNKTFPATYESIQLWISELAKQSDSRSSFNELMDTPVDFSNFLMNWLKVDTLTPELLAGLTYELLKGSCKSLQYPHNLLKPLPLIPNNRGRRVIPFDHFINNDLEYLRGGASSHKYTTFVTKTKATDYEHIKWIKDLVPRTMWIQEPIGYDKYALWGVSHWGRKRQQFYGFAVNRESSRDVYSKRRIIAVTELKIVEWHNYKNLDWITVRRDDEKVYKFKEGDFKRLCIQDIEDMLLLLVQGKLTNLIKKLNLTKPDTYRSDLKRKEAYIAYSNPRGFIYQNKDKKNRLMRIDKLHKFNDGMLTDVRTALDDRLKGICMQYLP
nr:hypothetical protein [Tanacetum cinerariifolium]